LEYCPDPVSYVAFVITLSPNFNTPFSTALNPPTPSLLNAFSPLLTVKFAKLISLPLRTLVVGIPKNKAFTLSCEICSSKYPR